MEVVNHVCEKCSRAFPTTCQLRIHSKICSVVENSNSSNETNDSIPSNELQNTPHTEPPTASSAEEEEEEVETEKAAKKEYTCRVCSKVFVNLNSFRRHERNLHFQGKRYCCRVCRRAFSRRYVCLQHEIKVHKFTAERSELKATPLSSLPPRLPPFRISPFKGFPTGRAPNGFYTNFGKPFTGINVSAIHKDNTKADNLSSTTEGKIECVCHICLQLFDDQDQLQHHKLAAHADMQSLTSGNASYQSQLSAYSSFEANSFFASSLTKPGLYTCGKCGKVFNHKSGYYRHVKMHTGIRPHVCEFCCSSFFRLEVLNNHKLKHYVNPEYCCFVCLRKANNAEELKDHFKIHTPAEIAAARQKQGWMKFYEKSGFLQDNEGLLSTGEGVSQMVSTTNSMNIDETSVISKFSPSIPQPDSSVGNGEQADNKYSCSKCNQQFTDHLKYSQHMLEHRGITSLYVCNICKKQFSNVDNYETHMKEHNESSKTPNTNQNEMDDKVIQRLLNNGNREITVTKIVTVSDNREQNPTVLETLPNDHIPYNVNNMQVCNLSSTEHVFGQQQYISTVGNTVTMNSIHESYVAMMNNICRYCNKSFRTEHDLLVHEANEHSYMMQQQSVGTPDVFNTSGTFQTPVQEASHDYLITMSDSITPNRPNSAPNSVFHDNNPALYSAVKNSFIPQITAVVSMERDEGFKNYKCCHCNKASNNLDVVLKHIDSDECMANLQGNAIDCSDISNKQLQRGSYKKCTTCKKQFISSSSLLSHVCVTQNVQEKTSPSSELTSDWVCTLCHTQVDSAASLEEHTRNIHFKFDIFACPVCNKIGSKTQIEKHVVVHLKKIASVVALNESLGDVLVNYTDSNVNHCQESMQMLGAADEQTDVGPAAERTVPSKCSALSTLSVKVKEEPETITDELTAESPSRTDSPNFEYCARCDETFPSDVFEKHLSSHQVRRDYTRERTFTSQHSGQELQVGSSASTVDQELFTVEELNNSSESERNVAYDGNIEQITIEPSIDIFNEIVDEQQEMSNLEYPKNNSSLMDHINGLVASGDLFSERRNVTPGKHIWSIKDDNKFKCSECGRVFGNQSSFYRHRRWHQGLMKYSCPFCSRLFYRRDQFRKHVESHSRQPKQIFEM